MYVNKQNNNNNDDASISTRSEITTVYRSIRFKKLRSKKNVTTKNADEPVNLIQQQAQNSQTTGKRMSDLNLEFLNKRLRQVSLHFMSTFSKANKPIQTRLES
jgi:hypothetical protein